MKTNLLVQWSQNLKKFVGCNLFILYNFARNYESNKRKLTMTLLENLNENDRFAKGIGAQLTEVREGYAKAELTVMEEHLNGAGVCQGGVIYTLADLAFAAVANCHGTLSLGISNTITFLKSAQLGAHITAVCSELLDHHKLPYCNIEVRDEDGELIAAMTGLAYRMKRDFPFEKLM